MARIRGIYESVAAQYYSSFKTVIDKTEKMLRSARKKLFVRNNISGRRTVLTKVKEETKSVTVPEFADVVVIGGGSAGCNALYHLAKRGVNAILLERSKLTSGTTWHTSGLFWRLRPNDVDIQLLDSTRKLLLNLEEETGVNPGWIQNGGLFIAHSDVRMQEYKRLSTIGKAFGIESEILSPEEAQKLFPLLDENSFTGAMYSPGDGTIDPTMFTAALVKAAKSHGARVIEECPVSRIFTEKDDSGWKKVTGVETPYGRIRTKNILNASGAWSGSLAGMIGLGIPLVPMKHAYIVTEPMSGVQGYPNVRDHDSNIYIKVHGSSMSIGGYESNPIILKSVAKDFAFSLYELDWNVFNKHVDEMVKLVPKLATTGIKSTICGPESFTPDHKPLMGEDPRCSGFFYSCGYNSAGMMYAGGCGEQIASWIINGRPDMHMYSYDIRRYSFDQIRDSVWVNEKSHEAYATNYSIIFPHDPPLSGRNFKKSKFHDLLGQNGAVMQESAGWERPGWYSSGKKLEVPPYDYFGNYGAKKNENDEYLKYVVKEHTFDFPEHHETIGDEALACRNNAALFDISYNGKFYLCGAEAQKAADYLFTADTHCKVNKTIHACMLNKRGGIEADCTITRIKPGSGGVTDPIFQRKAFYIVCEGTLATHVWAHMNKIVKEKGIEATLHDATDNMGILSIQGPNSRNILQELIEDDLSDDNFPYSSSLVTNIDGCLVRALRISSVGELGYQLHIPHQSCEKVFHAVIKAGKNYKMKLAGCRAWYSLSSEKGTPLWNFDLTSFDNPLEAGLEHLCREEGDYLGKKGIIWAQSEGLKRKLVHFHLKDRVPLWGLETVYRNGKIVGYLRRAEFAYSLKRSIGQGYVSHPDNENLTNSFLESGDYSIEVMGKKYSADIFLRSPFDPNDKRLQGQYSK